MKILGGELKGRQIVAPKTTATRPLSDKVRGAIFDITGVPEKAVVLDAYAGSGAAGFEALSRGAGMVEAIEAAPAAIRAIEANVRGLGIDWGYVLHSLKVETWLALPANQPLDGSVRTIQRYDLIIVDPPYARIDIEIVERLAAFLTDGGVMALSHGGKVASPVLKSYELVRAKQYGDTALSFYQRT